MTGHAKRKLDGLQKVKLLLLQSEPGLTFAELAKAVGVDRATGYRYVRELGAIADSAGRYTFVPTQEDVAFAHAILKRLESSK